MTRIAIFGRAGPASAGPQFWPFTSFQKRTNRKVLGKVFGTEENEGNKQNSSGTEEFFVSFVSFCKSSVSSFLTAA